jgi:hypothetical protein
LHQRDLPAAAKPGAEWALYSSRSGGLLATLTDLALSAAVGFIEARLQTLRQQALQTTADFATQLGVAAARTASAVVDTQLSNARVEADAIRPSLNAGDVRGAATHVAGFVQAIDQALQAVAAGDPPTPALATFLLTALGAAAPAPNGLVRQLGFISTAPTAIEADLQHVTYRLTAAAGLTLSAGPLRLGLGATELDATLRLDGQSPLLAATVRATASDFSVADPVVSALIGSAGAARADIVFGMDIDRGLTVGGSPHQRASLPALPSGGALDIRGLQLSVPDPSEATNAVDIGAAVATSLGGVIGVLVDGAGVRVHVDPGALSGAGTPLSIEARLADGIGVDLDTGLAVGGGFLAHRHVDGRDDFGGALELKLGPVEVKAFGILSLGGDTGFSLIIVMSVEFDPPIELGLLVTLTGVGGIIGVQRALDTDALAAGLHSHAIDNLLFPPDPIAAAPAIVSTLASVFPPRRGAIVLGPMLKLGWGRPINFVTAALAVVVSAPDPKLTVLGDLRVQVPAPQLPIVDLRGQAFGEFGSDKTFLRAVLEDSRVAFYAVSGDMGFLVRYSGSQEVAYSAGGFHPRFTPPPELGGMQRLAVDFSPPSVLRLRSESYTAATSNSYQFGNRVDLAAVVGPVSADGFFEFDAIVHFSPFAFQVDLIAGVHIRFEDHSIAGVDLHLHLEGPRPWRAEGTATFSILWFDKDVHVGPLQWGADDQQPDPVASPRQLVATELSQAHAWQALLPPGADRLVELFPSPVDANIYVHPLGLFEVRQRLVPMETVITHIGGSRVASDEGRLHFGQPTVNGHDVQALSEVTDLFAPGEFLDLTDDERLSRPAFEPMQAGMRINPPAGAAFDAGRALQSDLEYHTFLGYQDPPRPKKQHNREIPLWLNSGAAVTLAGGAAGRSPLRSAARYFVESDPLTMADAAAVQVRSVTDLSVESPVLTYTHAAELLLASPAAQLVHVGVAP